MKQIVVFLACLLLPALPGAWAQDSPAQLAAKLGSRNYAEREQAAQRLEKFGKAALPALEKALDAADLETRRRALTLMDKIEDRVFREDLTIGTPTRIRMDDLPLGDALHEVERQTGLRFGVPRGKERLTLDSGAVPFWRAWGKLRAASKLVESDYAQSAGKLKVLSLGDMQQLLELTSRREFEIKPPFTSPRLEFASGPPGAGWAEDDRGALRVKLRWHSLDPSDAKTSFAIIAVEVRAEPRLAIVSVPRAEIVKIIDDQGQARPIQPRRHYPQVAQEPDADVLDAYVGEVQYGGLLQLKALAWDGPPRALKEVHGKIKLNATMKPPLIEVPQIQRAVGKEYRGREGVGLKVVKVMNQDDGFHVWLHLDRLGSLTPQTPEEKIVRIRPGLIAERGVMDVAIERLALVDRSGRQCSLRESGYAALPGGTGHEAKLIFTAPDSGTDDLKLIMSRAPRTVALEVPFLVRDVETLDRK